MKHSEFVPRSCPAFSVVPRYFISLPVLSSLYPFLLISFSSFFPGAPYRISHPYLPWLPCHFYLVVIEQQHPTGFSFCFFPGFLAIFTRLSSNNNNIIWYNYAWQLCSARYLCQCACVCLLGLQILVSTLFWDRVFLWCGSC